MADKTKILRSYLNIILPDGSFQSLEANGRQERGKAVEVAQRYGARKAILHYCYENGEIGRPDVLFSKTEQDHSSDD